MTTNFLERLDQALIRPGRVDRKQLIDLATPYQLQKMYERFYPEMPETAAIEFGQAVENTGRRYSMAQLQGYFMFYKDSAKGALSNTEKLLTL